MKLPNPLLNIVGFLLRKLCTKNRSTAFQMLPTLLSLFRAKIYIKIAHENKSDSKIH